MACASLLPADPLQVGVTSGDIAPQDMFNPILYKAVSNESMSTLEARIVGLQAQPSMNVFNGQSVEKTDDATDLSNDFGVYYALLANRDGFRTASPQAGFSMKNLVPLVFEQYFNLGANNQNQLQSTVIRENSAGTALETFNYAAKSMRGRPHPMPRFNTTYITGVVSSGSGWVLNGMDAGTPVNAQAEMPTLMPVYTAAIVMPPSKLNVLYYRLHVVTTLEFSEVRPIQEITTFNQMNDYSQIVYGTDYATQSKSMSNVMGMVDTRNADITKIMDGA